MRYTTFILLWAALLLAGCTRDTTVREQRDGYTIERVALPSGNAYLLVPTPPTPLQRGGSNDKMPAVVVLHDHGAHFTIGKEKMVRPMADEATWIQEDAQAWKDKFYAGQAVGDSLAKEGYVVLAVDAYGWGERHPQAPSKEGDVSPSDIKARNKELFNRQPEIAKSLMDSTGRTWMEEMIRGDKEAVEYLMGLEYVDTNRVYSFGFSMGAVRSWALAASDSRIAGAAFSNWMTTRASLEAFNPKQLTGPSSYPMSIDGAFPGMDYPEVARMIHPRPILMMAGTEDKLFDIESVREAAEIIGGETYWFEVGHMFGHEQYETLREWLRWAPSRERTAARERFREHKLGIFLHWGIYSVYGLGEWHMAVDNVARSEYMQAAKRFNPTEFDARQWVEDIAASGARYICFTTRHHDGFSMWATKQSDYNIVDATPYGRDVLRELVDACHEQGLGVHLYYSLVDWQRDDYPMGSSCRKNGKDSTSAGDYAHYLAFMKAQLTELLTEYGQVDAIWFDGQWDQEDAYLPDLVRTGRTEVFDWKLEELYELIHRLQPACLVVNNHHHLPQVGEDVQVFERDLPGEDKGGYSHGQAVSARLPLETCETMNWSWGYRADDIWYKSTEQLRELLQKANAKGANLLLNIGPEPSGRLPEEAVKRLRGL